MPRPPKNDLDGYLFIVTTFARTGKQPSLSAIAQRLGYNSKTSAQQLLQRLADQGRISYEKGQVGLVHKPLPLAGESTIPVPVVGSVSCGTLDLAEQVFQDHIDVSTVLARPGYHYFILRAKGLSMDLSGINDGDLVLVRQQSTAKNGDSVVALVNDEATIKHFHREKGFVVLKPNSTDDTIKPIILSDEFMIQGIVVTTLPDPF